MNGSRARGALFYRQARRAAIAEVVLWILAEMFVVATMLDSIELLLISREQAGEQADK